MAFVYGLNANLAFSDNWWCLAALGGWRRCDVNMERSSLSLSLSSWQPIERELHGGWLRRRWYSMI